jgi:hypothetical protein
MQSVARSLVRLASAQQRASSVSCSSRARAAARVAALQRRGLHRPAVRLCARHTVRHPCASAPPHRLQRRIRARQQRAPGSAATAPRRRSKRWVVIVRAGALQVTGSAAARVASKSGADSTALSCAADAAAHGGVGSAAQRRERGRRAMQRAAGRERCTASLRQCTEPRCSDAGSRNARAPAQRAPESKPRQSAAGRSRLQPQSSVQRRGDTSVLSVRAEPAFAAERPAFNDPRRARRTRVWMPVARARPCDAAWTSGQSSKRRPTVARISRPASTAVPARGSRSPPRRKACGRPRRRCGGVDAPQRRQA